LAFFRVDRVFPADDRPPIPAATVVLFLAPPFLAGRTSCGVESAAVGAAGASTKAGYFGGSAGEPAARLFVARDVRDLRPGDAFLFVGFGFRTGLRILPEAMPGLIASATTGFGCASPVLVFLGISSSTEIILRVSKASRIPPVPPESRETMPEWRCRINAWFNSLLK
jgi:hypothetical protein